MTKSKLEKAVEERAGQLGKAQRELVLAQFAAFKRNKQRIGTLDDMLSALNARPTGTLDEVRAKQAERSALAYEHAQLTAANSRISAELFEFLKE